MLAAIAVAVPLIGFAREARFSQNPTRPSPDDIRRQMEIAQVEDWLRNIPDKAAAKFFLAQRYAQLGNLQRSLSLLKEAIASGEGFDPEGVRSLGALANLPEFQKLVSEIHQRQPAVHKARVAFTIAQPALFPEGLAADPARHIFYMGSMHRKKIIKIAEDGSVSDFVPPNLYDLTPVGGVHADPADHSVWVATDPGEKNRSELVHFDDRGKLLERYPAPGAGDHDLNDLVIRDSNEIYVTDTSANSVYRFDRKGHTFTQIGFPRLIFYPNGIAVPDDDRSKVYVADMFGVLLVDLNKGFAKEVDAGKGTTLAGIDGLYCYKGGLIGVQYGAGAHRVMRWKLSPDGLKVISAEVLEYRTPLTSFPTTGAIVGDKFYFIENTGIGNLRDDKIVDPKKLEPIHIGVVALN